MSINLYNPNVQHITIYDAEKKGNAPYNHDVSVAWFNGKFYAAWNTHPTSELEGEPGQINVLAESSDFINWGNSQPFLAEINSPDGVMWQPNLLPMGDELWCFWCLTHPEGKNWPVKHSGTWLSRMDKSGNWTHRLLFDHHEINGKQTVAFPSQNPFLCSNGRVLVPVTFIDAPPNNPAASKHWNAALYSDDHGATWQVSSLLSQPDNAWANWEPHFHEQVDGKIRAFMRNMNRSIPHDSKHWTLTAESKDNVIDHPLVFEQEPQFSFIETANSRLHVFRLDKGGYCMLHHDCTVDHGTYDSRYNLALFFSRTGKDDFVPSVPFSRKNIISAYPQGLTHNGKIYAAYTVGGTGCQRSIEGAIIDEQPNLANLPLHVRAKDRIKLRTYKNDCNLTCAERTNSDFCPTAPQPTEEGILISPDVSAPVALPNIDFRNGETLSVKSDIQLLQPEPEGFLVLCSLGDRDPVRIGLPANRSGKLYASFQEHWFPCGTVPDSASLSLDIVFDKDGVYVNGTRLDLPGFIPSPRFFFGDGFDSGYLLNNQHGSFRITTAELTTG